MDTQNIHFLIFKKEINSKDVTQGLAKCQVNTVEKMERTVNKLKTPIDSNHNFW